MPRRKDRGPETTVVKVRMPVELVDKCKEARLSGTHKLEAESTFLGYLIELGLARYEKVIRPIEQSEDEVISLKSNKGHDLDDNLTFKDKMSV